MAPRIISVVGKTNSGKTTLVERIIPELKKRSYRVGAIKHDVHHFEVDYEGKDTWRMTQAGADAVAIASAEKFCFMKRLDAEKTIDEIVKELFMDADIVITEGYKRENKPKIEVSRTGELLCADKTLFAIVENSRGEDKFALPDNLKSVPLFSINQTAEIADLIERNFLK